MSKDPYSRWVPIYDKVFERLGRDARLLAFSMFPPEKKMRVLEVGCGTGVLLEVYRKSQCQLFGIDASPSMLNVARKRFGDTADLLLGDATGMPYESGTFDLVFCMLVLHEMDKTTRMSVIAEMKRVLKSGGRILMIDFHAGPARPLEGWLMKLVILFAELANGQRHFRNYRHFMSIGGLPTLISESDLNIEQEKRIFGETMALYCLSQHN